MPKIQFKKRYSPILVSQKTNLMQILREQNIPVASSCNGDGICSKCKVKIISGMDNINTPTNLELDKFERKLITNEERLSCQIKVSGDIEIDTDYW